MFLKLSLYGNPIIVNMDHVYDFHGDFVEGVPDGSLLHFTNAVQPYGPKEKTHFKKHVDQSPEEILEALAVISK
jgi:hypothetical protein